MDLSQHEHWAYRPVLQPINISNPPVNSVNYSNYNNNPVLQPINTSNAPVNSVNYSNYNNNPVLRSIYTSSTPAISVNNSNCNNNPVFQSINTSNTPVTSVNNTNNNNNPILRSIYTSNTHVTGKNNSNYNNKTVLQPINISNSSVNSVNNGNYNSNPVLQAIKKSNTSANSVYYNNYNNNLKNFTNNNKFKNQLSNEEVSVVVQSPGSAESTSIDSSSTSPVDFEEPVKDLSKSNVQSKKSPEENNNNEEDSIKNESMSSSSSRSDSIDERIVSYAEVIKYSKPSKPKKSIQIELNGVSKKIESTKSNRIPPSQKISIKLPEGFLPNNQFCAFCKNNGERDTVYRTHFVKDELGNVTCPLLYIYICPTCGATGAKAHTISRCPKANKKKKKF